MAASECVRVAVRCRPPNSREAGERLVVSVDDAAGRVELAISLAGEAPRAFTFDHAFGPGASQQHVYNATARELVDSALAGYNATLFAFGQTGTGKTHTMEGCASSSSSSSSGSGGGGGAAPAGGLHPEAGIIPRTFGQIFAAIGASQDQTFLVRASMLEIYNEEIRDLLSKVRVGAAGKAAGVGAPASVCNLVLLHCTCGGSKGVACCVAESSKVLSTCCN